MPPPLAALARFRGPHWPKLHAAPVCISPKTFSKCLPAALKSKYLSSEPTLAVLRPLKLAILFDTSFKGQVREFFRSQALRQDCVRLASNHSEGSVTCLGTFWNHFPDSFLSPWPIHEPLQWPWPPSAHIAERLKKPKWLPDPRPQLLEVDSWLMLN